ncbi:hypothetical protein [Streptomyces sp. NPDC001744]|uniref:hypothetical protein n=1 Tax=Streptomyces sp. NPDC001744 TaxID=3364606 RepID=UPI0036819AA6
MSDTTNNYGNVVNMNGGHHNWGIVYGGDGAGDEALRAAVADLARLLQELRPHLTPDQERTVERALPEPTADRAALRERALVLVSAATQIAAAVGALGQPVVEAVSRLLQLLG